MNTNLIYQISTVALVLILSAVLIAIYVLPEDDKETKLNDDVKDSVSFDLLDEYTGSSMAGSVFVSYEGHDTRITILAHIDITEKDVGPAFIFLDDSLVVADAITDYNETLSKKYIEYAQSEGGKANYLQIGYLHPSNYDKGSGNIAVNLVLKDKGTVPSEVLLSMGIGSKINDDGTYQNCLTSKDLSLRIWS